MSKKAKKAPVVKEQNVKRKPLAKKDLEKVAGGSGGTIYVGR